MFFIFDFFDAEKSCPNDLKGLKEQYFKEIAEFEHCKHCELLQIREKYINILVERHHM
jgi:hypothetical protein